jgi:hypothetical protein
MAQPTFMPEGASPKIQDTKLRTWKKTLGAYQDSVGGFASNDPQIWDTLRMTKRKFLKSIRGEA